LLIIIRYAHHQCNRITLLTVTTLMQCSICRGDGGLTPYWLMTTPTGD